MDPKHLLVRARLLASRHGVIAAVAYTSVATLAFLPLRPYLGSEQWGWPYMLVVVLTAGTAGVGPAVLSALLSFLLWNFMFIRPFHTLRVTDSGDFLHLMAFLVVAVTVGLQTGRLRDSEAAALRQESRSAALYRLSSAMVTGLSVSEMAALVDAEVMNVLGGHGVRVWAREDQSSKVIPVTLLPGEDGDDASAAVVEAMLAMVTDPPETMRADGDLFLRLDTSGRSEGVLQLCGLAELDTTDLPFATSVAHVVSAYLENRRMNEVAARASAERETERLRTSLVSSVSHELKTPVAALTASVTDLLERDETPPAEDLRSNLSAMAEDLERLDRSIGNLLDLSRLEAQAWQPHPERFEIGELVGSVMSELPRARRERVEFSIPEGVPAVCADFVQVSRALRHIVDNALRYSQGHVIIGARAHGAEEISVWVSDSGPGIPDDERQRVFEKFYRGRSGRQSTSSTGIGLALAREIIAANHGGILIESAHPTGTRVVLELPTDKERS